MKKEWTGLILGILGVLTGFVVGGLAWVELVSSQLAYKISGLVLMVCFIGWIMHMFVVSDQLREKRRRGKDKTN